MKKPVLIILFLLVANIQALYAQVTIGEIKKVEERMISKPEAYDSLENWQHHKDLREYKRYIGLQVYLPPMSNGDRALSNTNQFTEEDLFMFSREVSVIKVGVESGYDYVYDKIRRKHDYDSVATYVYKPFHYYYGYTGDHRGGDYRDYRVLVCSDSSEVSNTYYTILDVIYGSRLDSVRVGIARTLYERSNNGDKKTLVHKLNPNKVRFMDNTWRSTNTLYLLKNDNTNDTLYSSGKHLVLVPFFIKQKEIYEGKDLVYDYERRLSSVTVTANRPLKVEDSRYRIKYEDEDGDERTKGKEVIVELNSKWFCREVTLLKVDNRWSGDRGEYLIHYILENDKGEQVALNKMDGFIEANEFARRETDKKLQKQELLAKQKREAEQKQEKLIRDQENRRVEMISLYGARLGEIIAQGKVQINMTKEMCQHSWGNPLRTSRTTTAQVVTEDWYYGYGYSLHFVNGVLRRIEE